MKAVALSAFETQPSLRNDFPEPTLGPNDIVVRVRASSINPVDEQIAAGRLRMLANYEFPVVLGRDFAGTVDQVGKSVKSFAVEDHVFGFVPPWNPTIHAGTWAERILLPGAAFTARLPDGVSLGLAGVSSLAILTALASVDFVRPGQDETVVVLGATGGVGTAAAQLAARAGATVIAPGLPEDETYLRKVGVARMIDRKQGLSEQLRSSKVDALIDLTSFTPDEFNANAAVLKPGGRAASALRAAGEGPGRANVSAVPTPENLARVGALLGDHTVRIPIQRTYRLEEAVAGLQGYGATHKQGKHAVAVD